MSESARTRKFTYRQFAHIRLLHLHRDIDGSLTGDLENFSLDDQTCPQFVTLSYVWGPPRYTKSIRLNGCPFPVLDNLYPLLEALCDYPCFQNDYWVWIDSICINQEDEHERAQQVLLMGRIYRQSTRTVIWLGLGTAETDRAIKFLHELAAVHFELPAAALQPETWDAIGVFFRQPWWTRVWTLQEFVLPSSLDIHCGENKIGDVDFHEAMQGLYQCKQNGIGDSSAWGTAWGRRRVRQVSKAPEAENRMSIVALLAFTGNYECVDPRDRVYSLLGLAREADRAIVGQPNYNPKNTVEAVYTNLVIDFIRVFESLDIICFAPLFRPQPTLSVSEGDTISQWPSWLPDWRVQIRPRLVPLMVSQPGQSHISSLRPLPWPETIDRESVPAYAASGSTRPDVHFDLSAQTLSCKGVYVDTIDGIATGMFEDDFIGDIRHTLIQSTSLTNAASTGGESPVRNTVQPFAAVDDDFVADIIYTLTIDRHSRYLEDVPPIEQFRAELHQLVSEVDISHDFRAETQSAIASARRWIQNNAPLLIRGRSLLDICQKIQPGPYEEDPDEQHLSERLLETIGLGDESGGKVLATLHHGHLGLVPVEAAKGDAIWVLQGCSVPVVLRRQNVQETYTLVGECYIHHFMDGEAYSKDWKAQHIVIK